jgi:cytochrome c nitrite reductase small subunit
MRERLTKLLQGLRPWLRELPRLGFVEPRWRTPSFVALGVLTGMGLLAFRVSEAHSYLLDDPKTCINCHIMVPEYATWERSSHRQFTTCNSCHVPHDNVFRQYFFKGKDGSRHSALFALKLEHQVINAIPESKEVIQENCLRCHARNLARAPQLVESGRACTDCHREVPHGDVHSLASTPNVVRPYLKNPSIFFGD